MFSITTIHMMSARNWQIHKYYLTDTFATFKNILISCSFIFRSFYSKSELTALFLLLCIVCSPTTTLHSTVPCHSTQAVLYCQIVNIGWLLLNKSSLFCSKNIFLISSPGLIIILKERVRTLTAMLYVYNRLWYM